MERYREILDFWFRPGAGPELWFGADAATDRVVRERFAGDLADAVAGKLDSWEGSPGSALALVVLLDQFSMQLHRRQRQGYEQSALALPVAERAIARGFDRQLDCTRRGFFYMPFMHVEDLAHQERGVQLFSKLVQECGPGEQEANTGFLKYARLHRDIVAHYGRFPGRNAAYGRESTYAERVYLDEGGYF
ncbi:MAG TPA: DUF924 family protein [Gammaproteobacteria bacterium]|jgi:uncharacterized protein (DUF924 family)|nr:DUF924 family protein [Gammaproteobacteria bacterium]